LFTPGVLLALFFRRRRFLSAFAGGAFGCFRGGPGLALLLLSLGFAPPFVLFALRFGRIALLDFALALGGLAPALGIVDRDLLAPQVGHDFAPLGAGRVDAVIDSEFAPADFFLCAESGLRPGALGGDPRLFGGHRIVLLRGQAPSRPHQDQEYE
jgi:hypothetical protein